MITSCRGAWRFGGAANALSYPPGEYGRKVKTQGIDGGLHKRWSMWFNSKQRAEPYQRLTSRSRLVETPSFSSAGSVTGAAWLSSARVVRCWVKRSEEHTSELQSLMRISYAVFCLKKKNNST